MNRIVLCVVALLVSNGGAAQQSATEEPTLSVTGSASTVGTREKDGVSGPSSFQAYPDAVSRGGQLGQDKGRRPKLAAPVLDDFHEHGLRPEIRRRLSSVRKQMADLEAEMTALTGATAQGGEFAQQARKLLPKYLKAEIEDPSKPLPSVRALARARSVAADLAANLAAAGKEHALGFLSPAELDAERVEILHSGSAGLAPRAQARVLPITVDGKPIVELMQPPDASVPALRSSLTMPENAFIWNGKPVPFHPPEAEPGTPMPDPALAGEFLRSKVGKNETLFLQTVALGDSASVWCSGVLVNPQKVLTAAHCVCDRGLTRIRIGRDWDAPAETLLVAGRHFFAGEQICKDARTAGEWSHELMRRGDLALLDLDAPVSSVGGIGTGLADLPIPFLLVRPEHLAAASYITIVGFGTTDVSNRNTVKNRGLVPIVSRDCGAGDFPCEPGRELVARNPLTSEDSCNGDSGGPGFVKLADGSYALAAIISRGLEPGERNCGKGGIYTLTTSKEVADWLGQQLDPLILASSAVSVAPPTQLGTSR